MWEEEEELPHLKIQPPPDFARCSQCGGAEIHSLPSFSAGSGILLRPIANDVFCRKCGTIAPPIYLREEGREKREEN